MGIRSNIHDTIQTKSRQTKDVPQSNAQKEETTSINQESKTLHWLGW